MKLRSGPALRPKLSAEFMGNFRRRRITSALAGLCVEQGYRATTIAHVAKRAGTSRGTVYELFDNKDDIFLALLEGAAAELFGRVDESCAAENAAPITRIEAALERLLAWVAAEPAAAWVLFVEAPSGPPEAFGLHFGLIAGFAERLDRHPPGDAALPGPVAEMIVGGIASILRGTLVAGRADRAPQLLPELVAYLRQPFFIAE